MKKVFALLLISAPVFAQDMTFRKEDPELLSIHAQLFLGEKLMMESVQKFKDGDLRRLLFDGIIPRDSSFEHTYGADGKIAERVERDENNQLAHAWVYVYKDDGSWEMAGYGYEDGERDEELSYIEKWDKDGKILSAEWKMEHYATVKIFIYDGNGRLVKMEETPDGASKPIAWEVYQYTDAGKLATKEAFVGGITKEKISYDDQGEISEVIRHDGNGVAYTKSVLTRVYKDFRGHKRKAEEKATSYNLKDGKWVKGSVSTAKMSYQYKKKKK
ncbi:MAG: hypothetical protein G01um101419_356 [Parcubacteria group bacterium Gr01-1014_19]|nr:MAG: hypothetical protein G01um101419_356 [Parcubacteria group bacterium Gr01-1014_19]